MDRTVRQLVALAAALAFLALAHASRAATPGTGFTYQGQIKKDGVAYTGACEFTFTLWDSIGAGNPPVGGVQIGGAQHYLNVPVTSGVFRLKIDFGQAAFAGEDRWLQLAAVCPSGDGALTTLAPRQQVTPAPYAISLPGLAVQQNATSPNVVGGYGGNSVTAGAVGATIGGGGTSGETNVVTDSYSTVAGGSHNQAGDGAGTANDQGNATVGGGYGNAAKAALSTIGGGLNNTVTGVFGTIAGGGGSPLDTAGGNRVTASWGTIAGGGGNQALGIFATVPGGRDNVAAADYSFAAGNRAHANHEGAFVWADSQAFDFASASPDSFRVRASGGGVRFVLGIDGTGAMTWSCLANDGNSWACSSDRNQKENLEEMDGIDVLSRVRTLPVVKWNGKGQNANVKHVGPMAQDFFEAFRLGDDDRMISSIDLDGVALLAVKGLDRVVEVRAASMEARLARLEAENRELQAQLRQLMDPEHGTPTR